jgi:hypothetical protein
MAHSAIINSKPGPLYAAAMGFQCRVVEGDIWLESYATHGPATA